MSKIKMYKKQIIILVILLGIILLSIKGFAYAKYAYNSTWDYYLKSKGFYFTSDKLDINEKKNIDNTWNGSSIYFEIKNSLNNNVITNYDINYTATCEVIGDAASYSQCRMNGSETNSYYGVLSSFQSCSNSTSDGVDVSLYNKTICEVNGYDWIDTEAIKNLYFDIVLTDENYKLEDITVNVDVKSTSPYSKILSGRFLLHNTNDLENEVNLEFKNYTNYNRLLVSNTSKDNKCVKISWDSSKLVIDSSNDIKFSVVDSDGYINQIKLNIESKKTLDFIFYSRDIITKYDVNEFLLEYDIEC